MQPNFANQGDLSQDEMDEEDVENGINRQGHNLATQLANLNDVLAKKEELASTMMANDEKMKEMREKYEKSLASLQEELATLSHEKENLDRQQAKAASNDPSCKIAETRRKR